MWIAAVICLFAATSTQLAAAANILALLPTPSPSHLRWNSVLLTALAARGHHVTIISPHPPNKVPNANLTNIVLEGTFEFVQSNWDFTTMEADGPVGLIETWSDWGVTLCDYWMNTKGLRTLLASKEKFDLILYEVVFNECFLGLVRHFDNPPLIGITAFAHPHWASKSTGDVETPSYIPNLYSIYSDHMSFWQRVRNTLICAYGNWYRNRVYLPKIDAITRQRLGEDLPSVGEIEANISLVMVNSHFSVDYPRPLLPALVPVGGLHIRPAKPLPQDLQTYLDEATDGAIFFSLGSNIRSSELRADALAAFLAAFAQLPRLRVLWKWELDASALSSALPANVRVSPWLPQNDVLAHPNVRLFITHGGLLSSQESVYRGVPMLGMPFIVDQHTNVHKAMAHGVAERLEYATLTEQMVLTQIRKMLETPSYRENMQRLSAQFRDQPQTPLERAVFWTEYVIRHRGATHLRSASADLVWYQYWLLDVLAVLALALLALLAACWLAVRTCWRVVKRRTTRKTKSS